MNKPANQYCLCRNATIVIKWLNLLGKELLTHGVWPRPQAHPEIGNSIW
jgi:hypothetical protein